MSPTATDSTADCTPSSPAVAYHMAFIVAVATPNLLLARDGPLLGVDCGVETADRAETAALRAACDLPCRKSSAPGCPYVVVANSPKQRENPVGQQDQS